MPVVSSLAWTLRRPSASTRKVTSSCAIPAGIGGMPFSVKRARLRSVGRELALALHDVDLEAGLVVFLRRVRRRAPSRDGRVARQDLVDHAAAHLDAERQREHVEEQHLVALPVAGEEIGLHRRAERDDLVGIDVASGSLPKSFAT